MENIDQIIHKSKVLTDRLRLLIILQNNLTQDGFDTKGVEFSNTLEALGKKLLLSEKNLQNIQDEVAETKQKFEKLSEELITITEENSSLARTQSALLNNIETTKKERTKKAQQFQNKLKAYKSLTGVRFDFNNASDDTLTGYISISLDNPLQCTLVPFYINKNNSNCSQLLWEKVEQACRDVLIDSN